MNGNYGDSVKVLLQCSLHTVTQVSCFHCYQTWKIVGNNLMNSAIKLLCISKPIVFSLNSLHIYSIAKEPFYPFATLFQSSNFLIHFCSTITVTIIRNPLLTYYLTKPLVCFPFRFNIEILWGRSKKLQLIISSLIQNP